MKTARRISHFLTTPLWMLTLCMNLAFAASAAATGQYAEIEALVQRGKYDDAAQRLERVLATSAENARAETLLGIVRAKQGKLDQAEVMFVKAIEHDPKMPAAYKNLAGLYEDYGNQDGAITVYERLLVERPADIPARVSLATLYEEKQQYDKSIAIAEAVPGGKRPTMLLPLLLSDYLSLKRGEDAQKLIGEILKRVPADPKLSLRVVDVFLSKGAVKDAGEFLRIASRMQKPNAFTLTASAKVQGREGQMEEAAVSLGRALKLKPNLVEAIVEKARLAILRNDWVAGAKLLRRAVELEPRNADSMQSLVFVLMKQGKVDEAYPVANLLRALRPNDLEASLALAMVYVRGKWWGAAKPILEQELKKHPDEPRLHLAMGIVRFQLGDLENAPADLEKALQRDTGSAEAHFYLGMIAKQQGNAAGAISELEKTIASAPNYLEALEALGPLYVQNGQLEKARDVLERAVAISPDKSGTHYQLAMIYTRLGQPEMAQKHTTEYQRLAKH